MGAEKGLALGAALGGLAGAEEEASLVVAEDEAAFDLVVGN